MLLFLIPSSQKDMPLRPDLTGESGPKVESDRMVHESAPFARIGIVAALRELLLPICERFLWYLKQNNAEIAKTTPITTPMEIPIISPVDSSFISFFFLFCYYSLLIIQSIDQPAKRCISHLTIIVKDMPLVITFHGCLVHVMKLNLTRSIIGIYSNFQSHSQKLLRITQNTQVEKIKRQRWRMTSLSWNKQPSILDKNNLPLPFHQVGNYNPSCLP